MNLSDDQKRYAVAAIGIIATAALVVGILAYTGQSGKGEKGDKGDPGDPGGPGGTGGSGGGVIGEIFAHISNSVKDVPNAILCDGTGGYKQTDYPALYDMLPSSLRNGTTFSVVDLRGQFLRGAGYTDTEFSGGRQALSTQLDGIKDHVHSYPDGAPILTSIGAVGWDTGKTYLGVDSQNTDTTRTTLPMTSGPTTETRPKNTAVFLWIKAK